MSQTRRAETASPCVRRCELDRNRRACIACLRTLDEIAGWRGFDEARKRAVIDRIAALKVPTPA